MQAASRTRWTVMVRTMCWEAARGFGLCIVAFTVLALSLGIGAAIFERPAPSFGKIAMLPILLLPAALMHGLLSAAALALLAPWRRIALYWQLIAYGILFAIYVAA